MIVVILLLKVLDVVLSIFAFATTSSPESKTTFRVDCANESKIVTFDYSYPYDLEDVCFKLPNCQGTVEKDFCLLDGSKASAEFYVFVGVIVFLYCLGALVLYIFFDELYRRNTRVVVVDFVVSIVLTLLWLISSSAWAAGLSDVKLYTDPDDGGIFERIDFCKADMTKCHTNSNGNFATLNVSIIFGFLNFLVWIGNLWFLYKETPWFKVQAKPPTAPDAPSTGKDVYVITNQPTQPTPSPPPPPPVQPQPPQPFQPPQTTPNPQQ